MGKKPRGFGFGLLPIFLHCEWLCQGAHVGNEGGISVLVQLFEERHFGMHTKPKAWRWAVVVGRWRWVLRGVKVMVGERGW